MSLRHHEIAEANHRILDPFTDEKLRLLGPLDTMVHFDFTFSPDWYPETNGGGFSLVNVDPTAPPDDLGSSTRWKASSAALGNPGVDDSSTSTKGRRSLSPSSR